MSLLNRNETVTEKDWSVAQHSRRYPATRTSPWFFIVLAIITTIVILAGIFQITPVARVVNWLATVL